MIQVIKPTPVKAKNRSSGVMNGSVFSGKPEG
jgi:hypothetical protein